MSEGRPRHFCRTLKNDRSPYVKGIVNRHFKPTISFLVVGLIVLAGCGTDPAAVDTGLPSTTATSSTVVASDPLPGPTSSVPPAISPTTTAASAPTQTTPPVTAARPGLTETTPVELRGVGPVRIGMSLAEASAAAGTPIVAKPGLRNCAFADPEGGPRGLTFMVIDGRIARIDVWGALATVAGVGVGDTEEQTQAAYGRQLEVAERLYRPGHYLMLIATGADRGYGAVFSTDGARVTSYTSGRWPEVAEPEGCS